MLAGDQELEGHDSEGPWGVWNEMLPGKAEAKRIEVCFLSKHQRHPAISQACEHSWPLSAHRTERSVLGDDPMCTPAR